MAGICWFPCLSCAIYWWRCPLSSLAGASLFFVVDRFDDFVAFDEPRNALIQQHKHSIRRQCADLNSNKLNSFPHISGSLATSLKSW